MYFEANDITDEDKQRSILFSVSRAKIYKLLRSLSASQEPRKNTSSDLTELLSKHYNSKLSEMVSRFKFNARLQTDEETVSEFVADLRHLSEFCNCPHCHKSILDILLHDRLPCGVRNSHIKRRLLAKDNTLTFEIALDEAPAMEVADKGKEETKAIAESKRLLQRADVGLLIHYDIQKPLVLAYDALPYGVGAVLSRKMEDGSERPVAFMSRTLTSAEKNYSQTDKEGLTVTFGVGKFHQYLCGHKFVIYIDHKPLVGLFSEEKAVPNMATARIQHWTLTLAKYNHTIVYRAGYANGNTDAMSRLPSPHKPENTPVPGEAMLLMDHMDSTL